MIILVLFIPLPLGGEGRDLTTGTIHQGEELPIVVGINLTHCSFAPPFFSVQAELKSNELGWTDLAWKETCRIRLYQASYGYDSLAFQKGLHEKALEDSEKALGFNKENIRALFRKARCLNELGRHKEAYECNSRCLLSLPHVSSGLHIYSH